MAITEEKALIKIASGTSGAQIRYTINGEDPTESDTLYTSSGVELDYGDVLRARAFKSGSMPSATSCYKNGFHNVTFEKVSDLDFLWNGTYESSSYSYKGYEDSYDYIHKFVCLNGIYFVLGYNFCVNYQSSDVSSTGSNTRTYNHKTFIKYSSDLKTWKDMEIPEIRQQYNNYWYFYVPVDITYFNNKYVVVGRYYATSVKPSSNSVYIDSDDFRLTTFSNSRYNNEYNLSNGNYMLIYDNIESTPLEYSMNNETLNCNINNYGWDSGFQFINTNKRLLMVGRSGNNITTIYTEDLLEFKSIISSSSDSTAPDSTYDNPYFYSDVLYANGKYYTIISWFYQGSSYHALLAESYDLKTWNNIGSPLNGSGSLVCKDSFIVNGHIYFTVDNNTDLYKCSVTNTGSFVERISMGSYYTVRFPYEDSIISFFDTNSTGQNITPLIFNTNTKQKITATGPYEIINNSIYYYDTSKSFLISKNEEENQFYCILYMQGTYTTSGATLEDSWPYCRYSVFKINID